MATIEGKPAAEWFADAAKRQKKSNAYAKYTPEAKKPAPEPARQVASMPKAADYASPAKPAPAPAKKPEAKPAPVAKTAEEEGQERIAYAKRMIADHMKDSEIRDLYRKRDIKNWQVGVDIERDRFEREKSETERKRDLRAARPGVVKVMDGAETMAKFAGSGIAAAAKAAKRTVEGSYSRLGTYIGNEVEKGRKFYGGVGKWLTGDPEAKKRLAAAAAAHGVK